MTVKDQADSSKKRSERTTWTNWEKEWNGTTTELFEFVHPSVGSD